MSVNDLLPAICIGITLVFAFINGFHDGGNVIATIVGSRSMLPTRALALAAASEFIGAVLLGTAVAQTMVSGILKPELLDALAPVNLYLMIIAAVGGAVLWKIPTWLMGLPASGSHALIGGLVGAGVVALGTQGVDVERCVWSVVLPLLVSPLIGLVGGFMVFAIIRSVFGGAHRGIGHMFEVLQKPTVIFLAASQGSNDAQKSMGVIALALTAGTSQLHGPLQFPLWVIFACSAALALGLCVGGWRIVKAVGFQIFRMQPVHSFASQFAASSVILTASLLGGPVSTTQVVTSSVMGVGASRRLSGVHWTMASQIAYAWLLTAPICAGLGAGACWLLFRFVAR